MRHVLLAVTVLCAGSSNVALADGQEGKDFEAPLPRSITTGYPPYYLPSSLPQPGTREVWQYYGVDGRGRWVPRVNLTPSGAYYYSSGAPFYYTTTQPRLYMQYVVD